MNFRLLERYSSGGAVMKLPELSESFCRRVFLVAALLCGLVLTALTPPFQVPDEPMHFRRTVAISQFELFGWMEEGRVGSDLPANLPDLERTLLGDIAGNPERKFSIDQLRRTWTDRASAESRFAGYPTAALFSPVPYVGGAVAAGLTLALDGPLLMAFYLARLVNLLLGILLLWLAMRVAPELSRVFLLIGLLPMVIFLRSSLSADVLTIGFAWLLIALIAQEWSRNESKPLLKNLVAMALILTKPLFAIIALLGFMHPLRERKWRDLALYIGSVVIAAVVAAQITGSALVPYRLDAPTDPDGQIRRTIEEPISVAATVLHDAVIHAPRYVAEAIGRLGWLDAPLPLAGLALFAVALLAIPLLSPAPGWLTPQLRVASLLLTAVGVLAILWSQFVLFTPPDAPGIEGTQGRHFLPLLPLPLIAILGLRRTDARAVSNVLLWIVVILSPILTVAVVLRRYWL
jgi:uncharacterized membrane protein